jgi:hypothetical protein
MKTNLTGSYGNEWNFKEVEFLEPEKSASQNDSEMQETRNKADGGREKKRLLVNRVIAGPTCTMAVLEESSTSHSLWGWGRICGMFSYDFNSPKQMRGLDLLKICGVKSTYELAISLVAFGIATCASLSLLGKRYFRTASFLC